MGADIKTLRTRIKSVDSTLHLTKAMGLVASSKIRRAMERCVKSREYEAALRGAVETLAISPECKRSPYMKQSEGEEKLCLIVIAGDRGLAGGYNANIFRALREYKDAHIIPIGKRACDRYEGGYPSAEKFSTAEASELAKKLCDGILDGSYTRVAILCTRYISMMSQEAELREVLPLRAPEKRGGSVGVIFEPDELTVLNSAVPEYVTGLLVSAARESFACEVAARRTAMDSAGKNAQQMIDGLTLEYNRARQGAITQEITEIVAGSDA